MSRDRRGNRSPRWSEREIARRGINTMRVSSVADLLSCALWRQSVPVMIVGLVVLMTNFMTPMLVGMYVDSFHVPVGEAGYTAAAYLTGGGIGGVAVSLLVLRVPTRRILALGIVLLSMGNFVSIFVTPLAGILIVRAVAGMGEGIGFGLMGAGISRLPYPSRVYGAFMVLMLLLAAVVYYMVPPLRRELGPRSILLPVIIAPLCLAPIVRRFPDLSRVKGAIHPTEDPSRISYSIGLMSLPLATLVIYVAYGSVFSYSERLGIRSGIDPNSVARLLADSSLVAVAGALLAMFSGGERRMPLKVVASLLGVVCCTWTMVVGGGAGYMIGLMVFSFVWFFFVPNLMTIVSVVDSDGRLSAATLGGMEWGMAAGPGVAGAYVGGLGLGVIAPIATVGFALGLVLLAPGMLRMRKFASNPIGKSASAG